MVRKLTAEERELAAWIIGYVGKNDLITVTILMKEKGLTQNQSNRLLMKLVKLNIVRKFANAYLLPK